MDLTVRMRNQRKRNTLSPQFQRVVFAISTCCLCDFNVLCSSIQRVVFSDLTLSSLSKFQIPSGSSHNPGSWLAYVAQIVIAMVGEVGGFHEDLVSWICPLNLEVQGGIGVVACQFACIEAPQLTCRLIDVIVSREDIAAHAVLPAKAPGGREFAPDAMTHSCHKLVAKVLHRVVAAKDVDVVVTCLMHPSVTQVEAFQPEVSPNQFVEVQSHLSLESHIVEVEVRAVIGVAGCVHDPVNHALSSMVESA